MNPAKKIAAGVAVAVVAAATALPYITGYMLENSIKEQLNGTAEQYNYSVSSVSINRSFTETTIDIALEGDNLRQLSGESLLLKGTLQHSGIFSLPDIARGDFHYTWYIFQEGVRLALPGTVKGSVNWHGDIRAELTAEGMELPLDASARATMSIQPVTASMTVTGKYGERKVQLEPDTLSWDIKEQGKQLGTITLAPSKLTYCNETRNWSMDIPSTSLNIYDEKDSAFLTIEDIELSGHQYSEDGLIRSNISLETGAFQIPELAHLNDGQLIEGISLSSSIENISQSAIKSLTKMYQELNLPDNDERIEELAQDFLVKLTQNNPRFALDDFTIKTANGSVGLAFNIESGEQINKLVTDLAELEYMTEEQENVFLLLLAEGLTSSAKITLSDKMLDWTCDRVGEQVAFEQGSSPMQARLVGGMCKTLAKNGDFLNLACLQTQNPIYQYQCTNTVEQAKKVWISDRSLEFRLEGGKLMINDAILELPVL